MITVKNRKREPILSNDICVHRGFPLGNPYSHLSNCKAEFKTDTKEEAIANYKSYLYDKIKTGDPAVCDAINELIIKRFRKEDFGLVCYCSPSSCHAEIIRDFINEQKYCINWFSNMRPLDQPFYYQRILFQTVENFYQAMKLPKDKLKDRRYIASLNPHRAKTEIRNFEVDPLFEERKLIVMEYGLRKKFAFGTSWQEKLLSTKGDIIEFNNWRDSFWGVDIYTGKGQNHLGKLLMKIRSEARV